MLTKPPSQFDTQDAFAAPVDVGSAKAPFLADRTPTATEDNQFLTIRDLIEVLMRRGRWMLLTLVTVLAVGFLWTSTRERTYASTMDVLVVQTQDKSSNEVPELQKLSELATNKSLATQMRILKSPGLLNEAFQELTPEEQKVGGTPTVSVSNTNKDDNVLTITITSLDPHAAAVMAKKLVEAFIRRDLAESRATATTALEYVNSEQARVTAELNAARKRLANFELQYGTVDEKGALLQFKDKNTQIEAEIADAAGNAQIARAVMSSLEQKMRGEDRAVVTDTTEEQNPILDKIDAQIQDLEAKRAELLLEFVPNAPEVMRVEGLIEATKERRARFLAVRMKSQTSSTNPLYQQLQQQYLTASTEADTAAIRLAVLTRQSARHNRALANLPTLETRASELVSGVRQLESTDELLRQSYQTLRISEASRISNVKVLSEARENYRAVSPNVPRNMMIFFLLGLGLAAGLAFVLEALDDRVYTQSAIERLSARPILAYIPLASEGQQARLIENTNQHSSILEGMRLLRSNLAFVAMDKPAKVLAVTSAGAGEGKSTTAINLAVALAMDNKRVVIIDADLRRPSLHAYFGIQREPGLTSILTGSATIDEVIQASATENVFLLPTGQLPPNPPEVLNSKQMHQLITDLSTRFDAVIVDTPPAAGLSDVSVLANVVDGIIIVVSSRETHRGQLHSALRTLEQIGAPIIGFVFNKVTANRGYYGYYYYYYYNYYYYSNYYAEDQENGQKKRRHRSKHANRRHGGGRGVGAAADAAPADRDAAE